MGNNENSSVFDVSIVNSILPTRLYGPLEAGDCLFIAYNDVKYKIGDYYQDTNGKIVQIYYEPKPWWQFWKKKKILGYQIIWM